MTPGSQHAVLAERRAALLLSVIPILLVAVGSWVARVYLPQDEFDAIWLRYRDVAYTYVPILGCAFVAFASFRRGSEGPLICLLGFALVIFSALAGPAIVLFQGNPYFSIAAIWLNLVIAAWAGGGAVFVAREWGRFTRAAQQGDEVGH